MHTDNTTPMSVKQTQNLIAQQHQSWLDVMAENTDLREQLAEKDEQIADLEAQLQAEKSRSTSIYMRYESVKEWIDKLFQNKTIPISCKIVMWQIFLTISSLHPSAVGTEERISMEDVASKIGTGTDTVRRAIDKMKEFDLLTRRYEKIESKDGIPRKLVHIRLDDIVERPNEIRMEKIHGGKREHVCRVDGEKLNNWTVRHCPTHHEISIYRQIDTHVEADDMQMVDDIIRKYEHRVNNALNQEIDICDASKSTSPALMEASSNVLSISPSVGPEAIPTAHSQLMTKTTKPSVQDTEQTSKILVPTGKKYHTTNTSNQKQDAFGTPEQLATEQYIDTYAASCFSSVGMCDICRYNQAYSIWKGGKKWCPDCMEKEKQADKQR